MKPTDALELLSVRSRNRLKDKYHTLPNSIGDFDFHKNYLQLFPIKRFLMGSFEGELELAPLLQRLIAGSYLHTYTTSASRKGTELYVNIQKEGVHLRGPLSSFSRKELKQLTCHLLVEQFDKEAALVEKKTTMAVLNPIREKRKALWKVHLLETALLDLIFQQKANNHQNFFKPGTGESVICGISDKIVPWVSEHYSNMSHLISSLFLSTIDLDTVSNVFYHLNSISAADYPPEFFEQVILDQYDLEEGYASEHFFPDNTYVHKRLADWEQRFGPLLKSDIADYMKHFNLRPHDFNEHKKTREGYNHFTPFEIKASLDKSVIGQNHAKRQISMVMYMHLLRNGIQPLPVGHFNIPMKESESPELPSPNMLLTGPTGSGKSFILNLLCDMFDLPHITIDCASLTASGYVGNSIADSFRGLYQKYSNDTHQLERAVVIFDEFDKVSEMQIRHNSVGGIEIQQEFLVLLDGKEFRFEESKRTDQIINIKTDKMMFVFCGSFHGIENVVRKRVGLKHAGLGFSRAADREDPEDSPDDLHSLITTDDLISFGIIPELAGRVNHLAPLQKLTHEDYIQILKKSDKSPLVGYENFFTLHHHTLEIKEEVYELLASEAMIGQTGARGLAALINKLLSDLMWRASHETDNRYLIDKEFYHKAMR